MAEPDTDSTVIHSTQFQFLRLQDVRAIEDALKQIGAFGELHLVVEQGRLGYVRILQSEPLGGSTLFTR